MLDRMTHAVRGRVDATSTLDGRVSIGAGTEVINSTIHGPTIIGSDARIVDAQIGPYTALGDRVHVSKSRIENSVVMEDSVIREMRRPVIDSLIGRKAQVAGTAHASDAVRLLLGDMCETELP